ncbi:hypothetical protein L1987_72953 [Smallanthus sonchifolius]|uniref:Uncharacterized protein n=1 Tax=Smallanthus sonchifolius TaxID=185202 RepID=A0ACB9B125_9ASTR|nr:hypothetical protein L1987_72953 [Smallanthus sonchifolius]
MMAGSPPPVTESIRSNAKGEAATSVKRSNLHLQVRVKELQKLETSEKNSMNISRRGLALFLTAASVSAVTLSSPKPAEARISKAEMKKMILEKLKILREKVGLSKQETEENEKIASSSPPPPEVDKEISPPATSAPSIGEEKTAVPPPEPPLPSIQNDKKVAVEAAILP